MPPASERSQRQHVLLLLFALAWAGCAGGYGNAGTSQADGVPMVCVPGDRRTCACGSEKGSQLCRPDGDGFDGCSCAIATTDGEVPGAGGGPPTSGCGVCDGCCRGTACVPFADETDALCGKKGQACRACGGDGLCDAPTGTCTLPGACNATTCPTGCCSDVGCVPVPDWSSCGARGGACAACARPGTVCEADGTCANALLAEHELFYVSIRSVHVLPTDAAEHDWDRFVLGHTAPDPLVCLSSSEPAGSASGERSGCAQLCPDTSDCMLTPSQGLIRHCYSAPSCLFCSGGMTLCEPTAFSGKALREGSIQIRVDDYDAGTANDPIGAATLPGTAVLHAGSYSTGSFQRVVEVGYDILYGLP